MAPGPDLPYAGWLSAAEAARRLGIKRETLYAYVSRGMLARRREVGGRESRFDPAEVARLAARTRSGGRAGRLDIVIDSALTLLDPIGKLWYRGWDAEAACRSATFEDVAEWLWAAGPAESGEPAGAPPGASPATPAATVAFEAPEDVLAVARRSAGAVAAGTSPIDRLRVALPAAATADPLRFDRRPDAVAASGRRIIAVLVDSLPPAGRNQRAGGTPSAPAGASPAASSTAAPSRAAPPTDGAAGSGRSVAERLWSRLCGATGTPEQLAVLDAALVLLADHEMASSTLAARVAASTGADPYLVVTAGLAVLGGPLHGSVGDRLVPTLREAVARGAAEVVAGTWRLGETVGGFGHLVYTHRDPRAAALWPLLQAAWPDSDVIEATSQLITTITAHGDAFPNVDLMLGTLVAAAGMVEGSAEVIFSVARTAGWLAHAIEEYRHRLRFRLRAAYVGPAPA
ncbi:MAG: citrate/2-methylcitrate synthase [Acidimicrobiales bacterium]